MIRWNIVLGDRLKYQGFDLRFDGRRDNALDWISERTGQRLELTDEELSVAIRKGEAEVIKLNRFGLDDQSPPSDFFGLKDKERAQAMRRFSYVQYAIRDGYTGAIKEEELRKSIKEWAAELHDPSAPCPRSVRRWLKRAGDRVTVGKLITNNAAKGYCRSQFDDVVEEIIEWSIDEHYKKREKPTVTSVCEHVRYHIGRFNRERGRNLPVPGSKAIQSAINRRSPAEIAAAREGEETAAQRFEEIVRLLDPEGPLDVVELDHTKADLIVIDDINNTVLGRPTLAVAIDRCTRMPVGVYIGFEPPSIHTVMQCLRNGMFAKDYVDEMVASGKWRLKNRWLVSGFIRTLILDRAMENLSFTIREWAKNIGTKVVLAGRRQARQKGGVERFIRTLTEDLLHEQKGTTFSNIVERAGYDSRKFAVVTMSELNFKVHKWFIDRFQVKPHKGFFVNDIPNRVWDEKIKLCPPDPTPNFSEIGHLFGRRFQATLQPWGLTLRYLEFCSPELVALLKDPDFRQNHPDGKMTFSIDPVDLTKIHVWIAHQRRWIVVPITEKWRPYATGLHWAAHLFIIKARRERTKGLTDLDALAEAKAEVCGWVQQTIGSKTVASSSRAARIAGNHSKSMAGGSTETTTPGSFEDSRQTEAAKPKGLRPKPTVNKPQSVVAGFLVEDLEETSELYDEAADPPADTKERGNLFEEV